MNAITTTNIPGNPRIGFLLFAIMIKIGKNIIENEISVEEAIMISLPQFFNLCKPIPPARLHIPIRDIEKHN
jgi:hypothetical protein